MCLGTGARTCVCVCVCVCVNVCTHNDFFVIDELTVLNNWS